MITDEQKRQAIRDALATDANLLQAVRANVLGPLVNTSGAELHIAYTKVTTLFPEYIPAE